MKYVSVFILIFVFATGCAESDFSAKQKISQDNLGNVSLSFGSIEPVPSGSIEPVPSGSIEPVPETERGCGFFYEQIPGYSCVPSGGTFGNLYYCCPQY